MEFPSISEIADAVKGLVTGDEGAPSDAAPAEEAPAATPEATEPAATEPTTAQEPETVATPETTKSADPASIAQFIDKDARAFFDALPESTKEALRPVVNKKYYDAQNERQRELERLRAGLAAMPDLIQKAVADQFDNVRMEAMSEEDRKTFLEKRELDRLRAEKDKPPVVLSPEQMSEVFAQTPLAGAFWSTVKEVGLPLNASDPNVQAFYNEVLREFPRTTSAEHGVQVIRSLSTKYKKAPAAPETPKVDIEAEIAKRVAEGVEAALDARLKKMGLLKADTGRAAAPASGRPVTSWEQARIEAAEEFRNAAR